MENNYSKKWFVLDFANVNIEDENEFLMFINRWIPGDQPPHSSLDELYVFKMMGEIHNSNNTGDLFTTLIPSRREFLKHQIEIMNYLRNFNEMAKVNASQTDRPSFTKILSDDLVIQLNEKLKNTHLTISLAPVPGGQVSQVIVPNLVDFESCLFYDFIQYANTHRTVLICALCSNYISTPNHYQFSNARKGYSTVHKDCQDDYRLRRDRDRKRKGDIK